MAFIGFTSLFCRLWLSEGQPILSHGVALDSRSGSSPIRSMVFLTR
jgi:hypothetical protein